VAILNEALIGYKIISEMYGPVHINEEMIGFTPANKVKVWLNENYSRNMPDSDSQIFRERRRTNEVNANKLMLA
jgi:hypothetical protein